MRFPLFIAALILAAAPASAEQAYPSVQLLTTGTTVMGEPIVYPAGPAKVSSTIVTLGPHSEAALHLHPVPMYAYVLEGEVTVEYQGHGRKIYKTGEALMEAQAVPHRGINTGDVPVRILCVFMGAEGAEGVRLVK